MYEGMFSGFYSMFRLIYAIGIIAVPLAIWKLVEIVIWLYTNINITVGTL